MSKSLCTRYRLPVGAIALALVMIMIVGVSPALADPHAGQSVNVVIIGGSTLDTGTPCGYSYATTNANVMYYSGGGCLPLSGSAGELGDFTFTAMSPADVSAANLAPFDTAVLNMASWAMACNTDTLSASQKADLVDFVADGHKLIIYDSECWPGPLDYSWMPFPFSTSNPGAMGAPGTLTIVEDNYLSTNDGADPHFVSAAYLSSNTDAVGDMNVMTTYDPNWCVDMSGTNYNQVTGPVHTYADYPAGSAAGLFIYNGMDMDYLYNNEANLRRVWTQELQQPFNPVVNLPCIVTPVGISISPESAENPVGTDHTVTATLLDLLGNPQEGEEVTFEVVSGPNAGASGTCAVNSDCTTDADGEVSWTYSSNGVAGTDVIIASFMNDAGQEIQSQNAEKTWVAPSTDCDVTVPGDYPTLQAAIYAVPEGTQICLDDGTWSGPGFSKIYITKKGVTIRSTSGNPNACVLDLGGATGFIIYGNGSMPTTIENIKIINGYNASYGAAIQCISSSVNVSGCIMMSNVTGKLGGAILLWKADAMIDDSVIDANYAGRYGGGIYAYLSTATIDGCNVEFNVAARMAGGIADFKSSVTITNSSVADNSPDDVVTIP